MKLTFYWCGRFRLINFFSSDTDGIQLVGWLVGFQNICKIIGKYWCTGVVVRRVRVKLRKAPVTIFMPVHPHVSARLPLKGLSWHLILRTFTKICGETPGVAKIGHFTWGRMDVSIVDSHTIRYVARQQCKSNPYLHFHGNTEQFSVIHCYVWANNQNVMYCCVSKPTVVSWTCRIVTLNLHCLFSWY